MKELDISDQIDKIVQKIANFIETTKEERGVEGVVILFSGFIDSTIISKIALDTLDEEQVKLLIRSDRYFEKQTDIQEKSIEYLGISEKNILHCDITGIMKNFGSEELIPGRSSEIPSFIHPISYSLLKSAFITELEGNTYGMVGKASSGREELIHKAIAHNKFRSRIQMAVAYLTAEMENAFLLGTINKTELLTGLFTKWGHGHCADIMPLGNLYRTQILQIANYLNVPSEIAGISKADLLPGVENKYEYFFDLSAYDVDRILVRLENGLSIEEINNQTGISLELIEKVNHYFASSVYTRAAPLIPRI